MTLRWFILRFFGGGHRIAMTGAALLLNGFFSTALYAEEGRVVGVMTLVPGPYFVSELSGFEGEQTFFMRDTPLTDDNDEQYRLRRALFGFEWNEVADHPCAFSMFEDELPHRFAEEPPERQSGEFRRWWEIDRESHANPNLDGKLLPHRLNWKSCAEDYFATGTNPRKAMRVATFDEGRYVHGLQVCTSWSSRRIKGLKIITREVALDGDPTSGVELDISSARPNCKKWHKRVTCDSDSQVGVGVVLHVENYNEARRANIVGLNLLCAEYKTGPWPQPDETSKPNRRPGTVRPRRQ